MTKRLSHSLWTQPANRQAFYLLTNSQDYAIAGYEPNFPEREPGSEAPLERPADIGGTYQLRMYVKCMPPGQPSAGMRYDVEKTRKLLTDFCKSFGLSPEEYKISDQATNFGQRQQPNFLVGIYFMATKEQLLNNTTKIPDLIQAIEEARIISAVAENETSLHDVTCREDNPVILLGNSYKTRNAFWTIDEARTWEFTDKLNPPMTVSFSHFANAASGHFNNIQIQTGASQLLSDTLRRFGIEAETGLATNTVGMSDKTTLMIKDSSSWLKLANLAKEYENIAARINR